MANDTDAAVYVRVSSEKQDVDLSISAQLKALKEYAARNGLKIVREYVDQAESGKTAARPAFREMIAAAKRSPRPFGVVLVWKFSRFARSREDSILFKTMLKKAGIKVVSISEPSEDSPTGKLLEAFIESLDEFYSQNLGEEVTRGMRESASRGFYLSAVSPYGYTKIKVRDGAKEHVKLQIDPSKAQTVRRIFEAVLDGNGLASVVKRLNGEGIAGPKGKGWSKTCIRQLLANEAYIGCAVWGRDSVRNLPVVRKEDAWPAIVSKEVFSRVQTAMLERAPQSVHPRRVDSRYLLSGIARCGHCGKALVGQDAKSGKFTYYVCGTVLKKGSGSCSGRYLNSERFEAALVNKLKERVLTTENLVELVKIVNEEIGSAAKEYSSRLDANLSETADVESRLERLYDALETGKVQLADLAPRIQQLRERRDQLVEFRWRLEQEFSERRVELADEKTIAACVHDLRGLLAEGTLAERRAFIRTFVKEVRVTGSDVVVTYTNPLGGVRTNEEKLGVLSIEQRGGRYRTRTCDLTDVNRVL
jgi:site-specific DNA recombinase